MQKDYHLSKLQAFNQALIYKNLKQTKMGKLKKGKDDSKG